MNFRAVSPGTRGHAADSSPAREPRTSLRATCEDCILWEPGDTCQTCGAVQPSEPARQHEWTFGPVESHHHTEDDLRRMREAMPDHVDKDAVQFSAGHQSKGASVYVLLYQRPWRAQTDIVGVYATEDAAVAGIERDMKEPRSALPSGEERQQYVVEKHEVHGA